MIRGIRGATTIDVDTPEAIHLATEYMIMRIIEANRLHAEDVASVFVTTTPDIKSGFPAKTVRSLEGWTRVPIMSAVEMDVEGALPKCIRLMLHVNTNLEQREVEHVYLNGAKVLRPDL